MVKKPGLFADRLRTVIVGRAATAAATADSRASVQSADAGFVAPALRYASSRQSGAESVSQRLRNMVAGGAVAGVPNAELVGCFYSAQIANEEQIVSRYQTPNEWRGFEIVRAPLYRCLLLAMAKIIFDDDQRSDNPSLKRLFRQFSNEKKKCTSPLLSYLENRFVERLEGRPEGTRERFSAHLEDIFAHWSTISKWAPWMALKTLRNKVIAHTDLHLSEGEWTLGDVNQIELGIKDFDKIRIGIVDFLSALSTSRSQQHGWTSSRFTKRDKRPLGAFGKQQLESGGPSSEH
jgi:hypothetical protein